jgi:hypothetical protein
MSIRIVQSSIASSVCCVAAAVCVCAVSRVWGVKHSDDLLWYIAPENLVQKTVAIPSQGAESTREGSSQRLRSGHRRSSTCVCQFDCRRRRSLTIPIWKIFNWIYFRLWILYVDSDLHKCDGAPSQHEKNQKKIKSNQIKYIYVDGLDIIIYTWCLHTFKSLMTRNWEMVLHQYGTRNYFQDK